MRKETKLTKRGSLWTRRCWRLAQDDVDRWCLPVTQMAVVHIDTPCPEPTKLLTHWSTHRNPTPTGPQQRMYLPPILPVPLIRHTRLYLPHSSQPAELIKFIHIEKPSKTSTNKGNRPNRDNHHILYVRFGRFAYSFYIPIHTSSTNYIWVAMM